MHIYEKHGKYSAYFVSCNRNICGVVCSIIQKINYVTDFIALPSVISSFHAFSFVMPSVFALVLPPFPSFYSLYLCWPNVKFNVSEHSIAILRSDDRIIHHRISVRNVENLSIFTIAKAMAAHISTRCVRGTLVSVCMTRRVHLQYIISHTYTFIV